MVSLSCLWNIVVTHIENVITVDSKNDDLVNIVQLSKTSAYLISEIYMPLVYFEKKKKTKEK